MSERLLYISDFSAAEINGGAESYDKVLVEELDCDFIKSFFFDSPEGYDKLIVSNFFQLSDAAKKEIMDFGNYVLIEHDYKIFPNRVPNQYENLVAPKEELVNTEFFKKAKALILQSFVQEDIFRRNLELDNIWNLHGNIWSDEELEVFRNTPQEKNGRGFTTSSPYVSKGQQQAIEVARQLRIPLDVLPMMENKEFIKKIGEYSVGLLFPQILESFGRIACECRMLGCLPITNSNMSSTFESFYDLSRIEIIDYMDQKRKDLIEFIKKV